MTSVGLRTNEGVFRLTSAICPLRAEIVARERAARRALEIAAEIARLAGDEEARASELQISSGLLAEMGVGRHLAAEAGDSDLEA
jgi:hypothetical protein